MKLFIQEFEDKFINNLSLIKHKDIDIITDSLDNDLYSMHYRYNFDTYVFVSSLMTNEIYQYILEFNKTKQIIVYHDSINEKLITDLSQYCVNVGASDAKNIIKIPSLINSHIFFNTRKQRNKYISCFIDGDKIPNDDLISVLYPHKKFHIRLFGFSLRKHPQNIGLLSEEEKAKILNESEGYLLIDDSYLPEALSCGVKILRPKDGQLVEDKDRTVIDTETYAQFLIRILQR